MSVTAQSPTGTQDARPFRAEVSEEALAELRRRIAATRWQSKELVRYTVRNRPQR
jgi:hypothetical protein